MTKTTAKSPQPSAKVKDTVTFFRLEKYKSVINQLVEETFTDESLPQIPLKHGNNVKYKSFKALQDDVKRFFKWCADNWALPTVNSLSLFLGWYSDLFYNYKKQPGYSEILKKAQDLMAYRLELATEETGSPGPMFLLKSSHGYSDQAQVQVTLSLDVDKLYAKALNTSSKDIPQLEDNAVKRIGQIELDDETVEAEYVSS